MSAPQSIVQAQTDALLRRVAREQEILSRRARESAGEQAQAIVARAREEARARCRQAAEEARRALERALADRRAALETAARRSEQAMLRALMVEAWRELPAALARLWLDPAARAGWCEAAAALARRTLLGTGPAVIELDTSAPADAATAAAARLEAPDPPVVTAIEGLGPGLRIRRGLACVDATIPGLLASRERTEAELLAALDPPASDDDGARR